ncbi:toxin VasX [Pantoea sp. Ap-967]|uniref:toxin VasX n=1 Tax=Pantoea sp. Ap-967 TaxID=2608362 RepID=UPI0014214445|nr:toxin VasX [Pantoea sp. Ap-967]
MPAVDTLAISIAGQTTKLQLAITRCLFPPLQSAKPYGLRLLRPGSYLYLFYFHQGRMKTRHYQVTEDVRFAHLWWTPEDYNSDAPGSHAHPDTARAAYHVLAPETRIADRVYLMVSEALLSHATLWRIEQDDGGLRSQLATAMQPAGSPKQPHVFDSAHAGNALADLKPSGTAGIFPLFAGPSKRPDFMARYGQALINLTRQLGPRPGVSPLAVALHDPIGIVSELHHLVTLAVERKTRYAGQHAHRLQSANFIAGYFNAANQQAGSNAETAEALKRQRKLLDYEGAMRFPDLYAQELAKLDNAVAETVADVIAWVRLIDAEQLLGKALETFDLQVKAVADAYEETVFDCLGGLVHCSEGRDLLHDVVMMPTDQSPFWLAVGNGSELLAGRFKEKAGDLVKGAFAVVDNYLDEHAGTPATNALMGLLQALPTIHKADVLVPRLKAVVEIRFNATIVMHEMNLADFVRQAKEFQTPEILEENKLKHWKSPRASANQIKFTVQIKIYELIKIGETTYQTTNPSHSTTQNNHLSKKETNLFLRTKHTLSSGLGPSLAGLGGYLAITNLTNTIKAARNSNETVFSVFELVGASATLIGAGIELTTTALSLKLQIAGQKTGLSTMKYLSSKFGVSFFGAGGAGLVSLIDSAKGIRAVKEKNTEQAAMYFGSAIAGGVIALASWAGGTAAAAGAISTAGPVTVLGLTPPGWSILALISLGAAIAFSAGVDLTKHGPVEIWLKHSAWGKHFKHYTNLEELNAVHNLHYRPRISADWQQTFGFRVGTLRITYQLPHSSDIPTEEFQTRLSLSLHEKNSNK